MSDAQGLEPSAAPCPSGTVRPYEHPEMRATIGDALRPGGLALTARVVESCEMTKGATVVDVGCGLGTTVAYLAECGFAALGIEPSATMIEHGRLARPHLDLRRGAAEALPLTDASADVVLLECVLSLIDDRRRALREAHRVLRTGGRLIMGDMYRRSGPPARCPDPDPGQDQPGRQGCCLRGLGDRRDVERLLSEAGFHLEHWQDETSALASLAAAAVFATGSLQAFLETVGLQTSDGCAASGARGLGYFVGVARRLDVPPRADDSPGADPTDGPGRGPDPSCGGGSDGP